MTITWQQSWWLVAMCFPLGAVLIGCIDMAADWWIARKAARAAK